MDKNNNQSISPSVNTPEETTPATTPETQDRKRPGLKLHTNIKAGGMSMVFRPEDGAEEL